MDIHKILAKVDHTLLLPGSTEEQIFALCDDGIKYGTASVCIPPSFVSRAAKYISGKVKICTVIGFPCGYTTTKTKLYETTQALNDGADEIDMVINIGWLKDRNPDAVLSEIRQIKSECKDTILKVIVETCLLTQEEKIKMCEIVTESGSDFIKTSTGFSTGGATFDDIELFARHIGKNVKIKASGGINSFEDAEKFINLGAARLGTSRLVKLVKSEENVKGDY